MAPSQLSQLTELVKRQVCPSGYYRSGYRCYRRSSWNNWGRWVALVLIVLFFVFVFFILSCITARRRRQRGLNPYRGTGWTAFGPFAANKNTYNPNQNAYQMNNQGAYNPTTGVVGGEPVPPYSPPHNAPANTSQGYYGGQQSGIEIQQPQSAYQPGTGGTGAYAPPPGPPPGKGTYGSDGVIR